MQKRAVSALLCLVLLFTAICFYAPPKATAATKAELESRIDEIDQEIAANRSKLSELKNKQEKQQEYLDTLQAQINANQEKANALGQQIDEIDKEIDTLNKQIKKLREEMQKLQDEIDKLNGKIEETRAEIEASKGELATKLRNSYVNGNESNLKILMGSSSLASFLTHLEMMKRMSENDKKTIDHFKEIVQKLKQQRAELKEKKQALKEKKDAVAATRAEKVERKNELKAKQDEFKKTVANLEKNYRAVNNLIAQLDRDSQVYQNYISKLQSERAAADKAIDEIIRKAAEEAARRRAAEEAARRAAEQQQQQQQNGNTTTTQSSSSTTTSTGSSNESWGYPVGGSTYISSGYGNRSASISGWSFHGGIDITGGSIYGRPVYASRSGTVIAANWVSTGYGNHVIIDHGDGYVSVYGHCSSLSVSTGQHVSKGQQIANVGSTGNSTGPHLHFEIRKNGVKVNPASYL